MNSIITNTEEQFKECACTGCPYQGSVHLEVELIKKKGWFCSSCTIDLKFHGIAKEVEQ